MNQQQTVKEISVHQLADWQKYHRPFQLIDVREAYEKRVADIGGKLIPLEQIYFHLAEFAHDKPVVIYCRSGRRSALAVAQLQQTTGRSNFYNLQGGILAWAAHIDTTLSLEL